MELSNSKMVWAFYYNGTIGIRESKGAKKITPARNS